MMRIPVFGWAMLVTCLMGLTAFYPYLALAAVPLLIFSATREFSARKSRSS